MAISLFIDNGKKRLKPEVQNDIVVEWSRAGMPGKMTFSVIVDKKLNCNVGDTVTLSVNKKPFFLGYIFTRNQTGPDTMSITCYDQLRYLKNKDSYVFENKTATQILQKIAEDFKLSYGKLANTEYKIPTFTQDNKPLIDIIGDALDETNIEKGAKYVLYDDFGKIRLRNENDMDLNFLVKEETAQSYSYTSSIDSETYNKIKIAQEGQISQGGNKKEEEKQRILSRAIFIAEDKDNMKRWGTLQHFEQINKDDNGKDKANKLLKEYNNPKKTLQINGVLGKTNVRAGCQIAVVLKSSIDRNTRKLIKLRVETVRHSFSDDVHMMDLTLQGKGFD